MRTVATLSAFLLLGLAQPGVAASRTVPVSTTAELTAAIAAAQPGDEIVLANGTYALGGNHGVNCANAGTVAAPIVVRAAQPLGAHVTSSAVEAFAVSAPNWWFEGLDIRGVCPDDANCEHAFHVTGRATGFRMLRNRVADFNAHLKVNADGDHRQPDGGLVESNEFVNSHPRQTSGPVTPVNIDIAADWIVRGNLIRDFHKAGGNEVSYGAFAKGGAKRPVFERNLVLCADLDPAGGARIGLSFGGGGMDPALCAPKYDASVPCDPEVEGGVMRNNIVVNCSDDGIYLNHAKDTKILYNTLIATGDIVFRFPSSTGEAEGNVLSAQIKNRDGGTSTGTANITGVSQEQFAAWYKDPMHGDLRGNGNARGPSGRGFPRSDVTEDFCGRPRQGDALDLGALQASAGDCAIVPQAPAPPQTPAPPRPRRGRGR